jgi:hypothetical protein
MEKTVLVNKIIDKESASGKKFWVIRAEGEETGFFCWDGNLVKNINEGDKVAISYEEGEYPRVVGIKKVKEPITKRLDDFSNINQRDEQIIRMSVLRDLCLLLADEKMTFEQKVERVKSMSESFKKWVIKGEW